MYHMRLEEPKFPGQKVKDMEHISLKEVTNHLDLSDVFTDRLLEFTQDMYYKQSNKNDHGYHFGSRRVVSTDHEESR